MDNQGSRTPAGSPDTDAIEQMLDKAAGAPGRPDGMWDRPDETLGLVGCHIVKLPVHRAHATESAGVRDYRYPHDPEAVQMCQQGMSSLVIRSADQAVPTRYHWLVGQHASADNVNSAIRSKRLATGH